VKVLFDAAWTQTIALFERHGGTLEGDDKGRSWCISSEPTRTQLASFVANAPCEFELDEEGGERPCNESAEHVGLMISEAGRAILTWCRDREGRTSVTLSVNAKEEHFQRDWCEARQWLLDVRVPIEELARLAGDEDL